MLSATAPRITAVAADNRGYIVLTVSKSLVASTVNTTDCQLLTAGIDGLFNTTDDVVQACNVSYSDSGKTITIKKPLVANTRYRIRLTAKSIKSTDGVALDGEFTSASTPSGDGAAGGNFDIVTSVASTSIAQFITPYGTTDVKLFTSQTPATVANFLYYANNAKWDGIFVERSQPGYVVQAGSFKIDNSTDRPVQLTADNPSGSPVNEPGISNTLGTISMAKKDDQPNSASNEWFFNIGDNSAMLDHQNGGFTVFGQATSGFSAITKINGLATVSIDGLTNIPVKDINVIYQRPGIDPKQDYIVVSRVSILMNITPASPWRMVGSADFNGDGKNDLVFRNYATGENKVWLMNGTTKTGELSLPTNSDLNQRLEAVGDFNGDHKADLVFRKYTTGAIYIWLMNGASRTSSVSLPSLSDLNWQIGAGADLSGDGKFDLVFHNASTGANQLWTIVNAARTAVTNLPTNSDTNQTLVGSADFNHDGKRDLIFRNEITGADYLWYMNHAVRSSIVSLPSQGDTDWYLDAVADLSGDGKPDIIFRNRRTGANTIWIMNGTTRASLVGLPVLT